LWPKGGFWIETTTRLFIVHKMIKQRHGAVQNIRIWKLKRAQENLLLGEMKTLKELGFEGEVRPQDRPKLLNEAGSPPGTANSMAEEGEEGNEAKESEDGGEKDDSGAVEFADGMVKESGEESRPTTGATNNNSRPTTSATDQTDFSVAPEDDYLHFRLIYDFTPANLDDPLLLISPRV
jgi:hypothetical protein